MHDCLSFHGISLLTLLYYASCETEGNFCVHSKAGKLELHDLEKNTQVLGQLRILRRQQHENNVGNVGQGLFDSCLKGFEHNAFRY